MAKKDVAKVPKGSKAAARKKEPKLSSWEKEYGDKLVGTRIRRNSTAGWAASGERNVYYDPESGKWLPGSGPATQVKKGRGGKRSAMKKGAKNKARGGGGKRSPVGGSLPPTREGI
jgi:hypothetical protein